MPRTVAIPLILLVASCLPERIDAYIDEARERCTESGTDGTTMTSMVSDSTSTEGTSTSGGMSDSGTSTDTTTMTTSETTESSDSTTTGEPMPVCGNGIVEDFGPEPEECDDGVDDPDDWCQNCIKDRIVFVSSTKHAGWSLMGISYGDTVCINRAGDVDLLDPLNYRAWLSDSETDARDRIKPGKGRYRLVNGLVVASSWEALLDGELENPIDANETGGVYHGDVWTGTLPDGTKVPDSEHCGDWDGDLVQEGYYGWSAFKTSEWTLSQAVDNPQVCATQSAFYCFEQGE